MNVTGAPRFRFTLINDILGEKQVSEPIGWDEIDAQLDRDKKTSWSLVELFETPLTFYRSNGILDGGLDYLVEVEETQGPDAYVAALLEIDPNGEGNWKYLTRRKVDIVNVKELSEGKRYKVTYPLIQDDFWSKLINRIDTQVDLMSALNMDGQAVTVYEPSIIILPTQTILLTSRYFGNLTTFDLPSPSIVYPVPSVIATETLDSFGPATLDLDTAEIRETFPSTLVIDQPLLDDVINQIEITEESGPLRIYAPAQHLRMYFSGAIGLTSPEESDPDQLIRHNLLVTLYIRKNSDPEMNVAQDSQTIEDDIPNPVIEGVPTFFNLDFNDLELPAFDETINVEPGDIVTVAMRYRFNPVIDAGTDHNVSWGYRELFLLEYTSDIKFEFNSQFPATQAQGFLIHDMGAIILDRITGTEGRFYSEYFGSDQTKTRQYPQNGCAWLIAAIKGVHVRGYTFDEKSSFGSFMNWWQAIDPTECLGFGLETIDDEECIRVEPRGHFFNPTPSLNLSRINGIERSYLTEAFYSRVKIGYEKWESEDSGGIDDMQTRREYALRFASIGEEIQIYSRAIAAALAIENARRTVRDKSADYKYDNDFYLLALKDVGASPPDTYEAALGDPYSDFTNVIDGENRYNWRFTCARNMLRFLDFLSGCLSQYPGSEFTFQSGEGNYKAGSTKADEDCPDDFTGPLTENQNIPKSNTPMFIPRLRTFTHPLTWDEYETIRSNPKNAIGISETSSGHVPHFIMNLKYKISHALGTFITLQAI